MEKVNKYIKDNYKLIIPLLLMLLLFIVFFVYYQVSSKDILTDSTDSFYQYFSDSKTNYDAVVTTNKRDEVVGFKSKNNTIDVSGSPIYYKNHDKVIFPMDMSVVMPTLSCAEYLSKGFSVVSYKDNTFNLITEKYNKRLNHYFFYDSKDLYFFIENVTLKFDNKEVKLTPFSYVIYRNSNKTLEYYDRENDKYQLIGRVDGQVIVSTEYYSVVVSNDYIDYNGSEVLLTSGIENLITIDMKD